MSWLGCSKCTNIQIRRRIESTSDFRHGVHCFFLFFFFCFVFPDPSSVAGLGFLSGASVWFPFFFLGSQQKSLDMPRICKARRSGIDTPRSRKISLQRKSGFEHSLSAQRYGDEEAVEWLVQSLAENCCVSPSCTAFVSDDTFGRGGEGFEFCDQVSPSAFRARSRRTSGSFDFTPEDSLQAGDQRGSCRLGLVARKAPAFGSSSPDPTLMHLLQNGSLLKEAVSRLRLRGLKNRVRH